MNALLDDQEASAVMSFTSTLQTALESEQPQRVGNQTHFDYEDAKEKREAAELKRKFKNLKIVSRAKVTKELVYCAAYHPEVTKDLIFFGGALVESTENKELTVYIHR